MYTDTVLHSLHTDFVWLVGTSNAEPTCLGHIHMCADCIPTVDRVPIVVG